MKECNYPKCETCTFNDCIMDDNDIAYMLRTRALPNCNNCEKCTAFINLKGDGDTRCCMLSGRMIGDGIKTSPKWCEKRRIESEVKKD